MIKSLSDHPIWMYFNEILKIPRPSEKEEHILSYLNEFAKQHKLEFKSDSVNNLVIYKPATKGMENKKPVVLQSHVDMVCEKNLETEFNFDTDPIEAYVEGDWIKARGTTLGGDDGIGMAAQLAILSDQKLKHGPIECLFTVDEESGMTGAKGLGTDILKGHILLNLDSEDEGELFIGCAGGIDTTAIYEPDWEFSLNGHSAYKVIVDGLKGGHSGDEIHKGLGNSIKILNQFLLNAIQKYNIGIAQLEGGHLRNAIPREAFAFITIQPQHIPAFNQDFILFSTQIKERLNKIDPDFRMRVEETDKPTRILKSQFILGMMESIEACPHGELAMSKQIKGLVETSTNLAAINFNKNRIEIITSQRSSVEQAKYNAAALVGDAFKSSGAEVSHSGGYPGWEPNPDSEILQITKAAYKGLFNTIPEVKAIHAGLECGLFLEKYPTLDMISFGPTIRGAHSPDERLHIPSVYKFWDLLIRVLEEIPEKS